MKHLIYLFTALLFTGFTVNAETLSTVEDTATSTTFVRGYGNSFIFTESGVEFSVFADGQFDFYMPNYSSNVNVSVGNRNTSISFNTGYDYGAYVQYDEFGAIIQIENIPIFYDHYGRITQAGDVYITGFINVYNRAYVYRPWHSYYVIPTFNYCVLYSTPYRQFYTPIRYTYDRPYRNNYRRRTAVASRRGNRITRSRSYASRTEGRKPRAINSRPRARGNATTSRPRTRDNATTSRPRTELEEIVTRKIADLKLEAIQ